LKIYVLASGGGHTGYAVAIGEALVDLEPEIDLSFILPPDDIWSLRKLKYRFRDFDPVFVVKPRRPLEGIGKALLLGPRALFDSLRFIKDPFMVIATGSNHGLIPIVILVE